jgi:DNA replication protein DnaC
MFTTAAGMITTLGKVLYDNQLKEQLKMLTQPKLLIINEIGYTPIDRQSVNLFFQLVFHRYKRGLILVNCHLHKMSGIQL